MKDFKYRSLYTNSTECKTALTSLDQVHPKIQACANVFQSNLKRISLFQVTLSEVIFITRKDDLFAANAAEKHRGRRPRTLAELAAEERFSGPALEDYQRQFLEFKKLPPTEQLQLREKIGIEYLEQFMFMSPDMTATMDAILGSVVLQSWTAFESFAGDLWCQGVDYGPPKIADKLFSSDLKKLSEPVSLNTIRHSPYDPRTHIGSFVRDIGKVSFQKLDSIKNLYGFAFGTATEHLFESTAGGQIFALAAVRNALVHRSGIADSQFVSQAKRFPEFNSLKVNDPIELDGVKVARLRDATAQLGAALAAAISEALKST